MHRINCEVVQGNLSGPKNAGKWKVCWRKRGYGATLHASEEEIGGGEGIVPPGEACGNPASRRGVRESCPQARVAGILPPGEAYENPAPSRGIRESCPQAKYAGFNSCGKTSTADNELILKNRVPYYFARPQILQFIIFHHRSAMGTSELVYCHL